MVTRSCINCNAQLNIVPEMTAFACGHCGLPLFVDRHGGGIVLQRQGVRPRPTNTTAPSPISTNSNQLKRLQEELAKAEKERGTALTRAGAQGIGWVLVITALSAFIVGWWAIGVFLLALWPQHVHAEKKKREVNAAFDSRMGQLRFDINKLTRMDLPFPITESVPSPKPAIHQSLANQPSFASRNPYRISNALTAGGGFLAGMATGIVASNTTANSGSKPVLAGSNATQDDRIQWGMFDSSIDTAIRDLNVSHEDAVRADAAADEVVAQTSLGVDSEQQFNQDLSKFTEPVHPDPADIGQCRVDDSISDDAEPVDSDSDSNYDESSD